MCDRRFSVPQFSRRVRVAVEREDTVRVLRALRQREVEILSHRIAVDLDRDAGARRRAEDLVPVRVHACARSEDATTWVCEYVNTARLDRR